MFSRFVSVCIATSVAILSVEGEAKCLTGECLRPLYYVGCGNDDVRCGEYGGFQLVCNMEEFANGQCLCAEDDEDCKVSVREKAKSKTPGYLPQYGEHCDQALGCEGSGHLCNIGHHFCKTCSEKVHCVRNRVDTFSQCHTCSSCMQQNNNYDCSTICEASRDEDPAAQQNPETTATGRKANKKARTACRRRA